MKRKLVALGPIFTAALGWSCGTESAAQPDGGAPAGPLDDVLRPSPLRTSAFAASKSARNSGFFIIALTASVAAI